MKSSQNQNIIYNYFKENDEKIQNQDKKAENQQENNNELLDKKENNNIDKNGEETKKCENTVIKGKITLKYNHYTEVMEIQDNQLKVIDIDERFFFSDVYKGNFIILLKNYPFDPKDKEIYEYNRKTHKFENLIDGKTYQLYIQEDEIEEEKARKKLRLFKEVHLTQMHDQIEFIRENNKIPCIIDNDDKSYIFFKYKGNIIDINDMKLREQMGKQTHEESLEEARVSILWALKSGYTCVILFDRKIVNINEFFKGAKYYVPEILFNPKKVKEPEFYKAHILKKDEDVDWDGNKGNFKPHKDFTMALLFSNKDEKTLELIEQNTGLDNDTLRVISINPELQKKFGDQNGQPFQQNNQCQVINNSDKTGSYYEYISKAYELR
ncbi:hypothetical protein PPERSA_09613 [Pseudocohnilembus persalinus]|uniref:Uncharacterized protein n=1 Tax=Pseudocohnilembus persalinus TaxID=266149 RepID=A0A0V0QFM1_PSEPJ|nr:hypothetical protein PPERSA_09613 [Pseudocohnilembus persalinus]|eukprot:KRX01007.1 hypothetical protein PPERSA_09613 [Pseudocohnilembus persalinus]